ncbi:MAG: 6-phosphofructokinase [Bryobacterales bacterium]
MRDISEDNRALPSPITVVEALGRNTGWIAAATALARNAPDDGPHLIYLPEQPPEAEQLIEDAKEAVAKWGRGVIVVGEGLRDGAGKPFDADLDRAGEPGELARNLAHALAIKIQQATGLRARAERPGLLGRSCSWALSETDVTESYRSGRAAAEAALGGASNVLVSLRRRPGLVYTSFPHITPFSEYPGRERKMPTEWAGEPGQGGTEDYLEWLRPLVGEVPAIERIV